MQKTNNKEIKIQISGLHAEAVALHILIVMKNFIPTLNNNGFSDSTANLLENLNTVYEKLNQLTQKSDDESLNTLHLKIAEAEAIIQAFINEPLKEAALKDPYYQNKSYSKYFEKIYANYLKLISVDYVMALAA